MLAWARRQHHIARGNYSCQSYFYCHPKFFPIALRAMKLRVWMKTQGKTQAALAEELGISQTHVAHLCAGKRWPGRETAERIREATRGMVSADDFMREPAE
jgi:predicted transcriptional regulator